MNKVTIRHVAEHAGVSTSTVSRTLHNHPRISEETKRRVIEAAEVLNYRSALFTGSQTLKALGLILPTSAEDLLMHPFFTQVMRGISTFAQARGYFTMYGFSQEEEEKLQFLRQYAFSGVVQGLILLAIHQNDRCIEFLSEHEIPFTVIGRPETPGDVLWVDNDNFHAMYDAVNHLIEDGARRIAFVGGPGLVYAMGMSSIWIVVSTAMSFTISFFLLAKRLRPLAPRMIYHPASIAGLNLAVDVGCGACQDE